MTPQELRDKIATNEYGAELMLQHAMRAIAQLEEFKHAVTEYFGSSRVFAALDERRSQDDVPF
jgi:hypothetical protein